MKVSHIESEYWSIKVSIAYSGSGPMGSLEEIFHILYHLILFYLEKPGIEFGTFCKADIVPLSNSNTHSLELYPTSSEGPHIPERLVKEMVKQQPNGNWWVKQGLGVDVLHWGSRITWFGCIIAFLGAIGIRVFSPHKCFIGRCP